MNNSTVQSKRDSNPSRCPCFMANFEEIAFIWLDFFSDNPIIVLANTNIGGVTVKLNADQMWEAWGRTNALYTAWCAAAGQNPYRVIVLYAIQAHAPITQKAIADYAGLSKQTVSTVMRALKAEGLVSLHAGESDHREKKVCLTQKGTLYAAEVLSPLHTLEQRVFDIMGAERMKQMTDAITLFNLVFEKEMETQANEHRTK